jgi:hypothetical protein
VADTEGVAKGWLDPTLVKAGRRLTLAEQPKLVLTSPKTGGSARLHRRRLFCALHLRAAGDWHTKSAIRIAKSETNPKHQIHIPKPHLA